DPLFLVQPGTYPRRDYMPTTILDEAIDNPVGGVQNPIEVGSYEKQKKRNADNENGRPYSSRRNSGCHFTCHGNISNTPRHPIDPVNAVIITPSVSCSGSSSPPQRPYISSGGPSQISTRYQSPGASRFRFQGPLEVEQTEDLEGY